MLKLLPNTAIKAEVIKCDIFNPPTLIKKISKDLIATAVLQFYKIGEQDFFSRYKPRHIAEARQISMYLCRQHSFKNSFPEIGYFFARDHSTIIHACNKVKNSHRLLLEVMKIENYIKELSDDL